MRNQRKQESAREKNKKIAPVFSPTNAILITFGRQNALPHSRSFHFSNQRKKEQKSLTRPLLSSESKTDRKRSGNEADFSLMENEKDELFHQIISRSERIIHTLALRIHLLHLINYLHHFHA